MGRRDNRRSMKMRRLTRQRKLKARLAKKSGAHPDKAATASAAKPAKKKAAAQKEVGAIPMSRVGGPEPRGLGGTQRRQPTRRGLGEGRLCRPDPWGFGGTQRRHEAHAD